MSLCLSVYTYECMPRCKPRLLLFQVDFRAACQCHSKMTDLGFVCSVCMSVYCGFRPICMTCNAHFKLPTALLKGKKVTGKRKLENGKS